MTSPRELRIAQCQTCSHPNRARIEMLRVGGASLDALARQFEVSRDSIHRHFKNHVSQRRRAELTAGPAKVEQLATAAADKSKGLLEYLVITRSVLFNQFLIAAEAGDRPGVANVAGRLLESLRELGKLTGELRQVSGFTINNNTVNLIASPEFLALQEGLLGVARKFPEARRDLISVLRTLDSGPSMPKPSGAHPPIIESEAMHVE